MIRVGVDAGGTFTDVILERSDPGIGRQVVVTKVASTPHDKSEGVVEGSTEDTRRQRGNAVQPLSGGRLKRNDIASGALPVTQNKIAVPRVGSRAVAGASELRINPKFAAAATDRAHRVLALRSRFVDDFSSGGEEWSRQ